MPNGAVPNGAKQLVLLVIGCALLAVSLVACSGGGGGGGSGASGSGVDGFKTPNPHLFTPIATFPPFTIGAWPSNYSPANNDTVTIYVLCRTQQSDSNGNLNGPGQPAAQQPVHVEITNPFTKSADGTTDTDGLATVPISYSDPQSGFPVRVYVSTSWHGRTYNAETVFTPNVTQPPPPTATPSPTP